VQDDWKDYETKHSKDYNSGDKISGLRRVSVQSKDTMQDCENVLKQQRFLGGNEPNKDDQELFDKLKENKYNLQNYPHIQYWLNIMSMKMW